MTEADGGGQATVDPDAVEAATATVQAVVENVENVIVGQHETIEQLIEELRKQQ